MSKVGSLARNVISNWIVLVGGIAYAIFMTPIIVRALDKELYGVWSFLNGLLAYSDLLYLGLGSAVIKYVAQYRATENHDGVGTLASTVLSIYGILGLVCWAALAIASPFIPHLFAEPLAPSTAHFATITCIILGAQMFCVFVGSAFSGVTCGHDRYDLVNAVYLCATIIRFIATPLLLNRGSSPLVVLAFLSLSISIFQSVAFAFAAHVSAHSLKIRFRVPTRADLAMLYGFGLQSFFLMLAIKLISYTDTAVIGVMLGATSVALYALPLQLIEYARVVVGGFSSVFLPRLTTSAIRSEHANIREAYINSLRISCFLSGWLIALLIGLGSAFLSRWVGPDFGRPVVGVIALLAIATFPQTIYSQAQLPFYQALHLVSFPALILMFEAILNLVLSVWLAPGLGITGVALASAIPAVSVSVVVLPRFLARRLGVPLRIVFTRSVAPGAMMAVLSLVALWTIGQVVRPVSYSEIVASALLTVPVAIGVVRFTFPVDQRDLIRGALRLKAGAR
jgi:O-antigen/teichoic acid export membrane protein